MKIKLPLLLFLFVSSVWIILFYSADLKASPLREGLNIKNRDVRVIEKILEEQLSFECKSIYQVDENSNPILNDMGEFVIAFEVSDGNRIYTLLIDTNSEGFLCLLDSNNNLVFGLVDNIFYTFCYK